jgi:glycosyltransferase involved in cell wall biosynthesis
MLAFELEHRVRKSRGWNRTISRNDVFQRYALRFLKKIEAAEAKHGGIPTLFSYSYAALEVFQFAKSRGWRTVLGQIDPGPEEERVVMGECARYPELASNWLPAPMSYWEHWREEVKLADRIVVNSRWSLDCLKKENIPASKIEIVPLVYSAPNQSGSSSAKTSSQVFRVLFLGQVNLRKGVARLLAAMRLLRDEPIELLMAGPSQIDPSAWADLPNVNWLGPIPRSEVGRHYREADLFILPTLSDGYALTQLEALAHGLPVLASAHCGEAVSEGTNGSILGSLEPEGIASALRTLRGASYGKITAPSFGLDELGSALLNLNFSGL